MRRLHILGAAGTVTGSRFLYETDTARVQIDAGLFQGGRRMRELNWHRVRGPRPGAVVLTHAHIDHSGYLPRMVAEGFRGPVFCTPGTAALLAFLLRDAAYIQEEDARRASRHEGVDVAPLYTMEDAEEALEMLRPVPLLEPVEVGPGLWSTFYEAGHILGAAHVRLEHEGHVTCISGDIGRYDALLLRDPEPVPDVDLLVMESTYGGRTHPDVDPSAALLEALQAIFQRGGVAVIPAFAVGRRQDLLLRLRQLMDAGALDPVPVWLDSPMAVGVTELYRNFPDRFDDELALAPDFPDNLLPATVGLARTTDESKALRQLQGPGVIISASGMCSGGRIMHHLSQRLEDPRNGVIFVGYQASGTLGRHLVEGGERARIHGRWYDVNASITSIDALSAHADHPTLLRWAARLPQRPSRIVLVHGEEEARQALATDLEQRLNVPVARPVQGQIFDLMEG